MAIFLFPSSGPNSLWCDHESTALPAVHGLIGTVGVLVGMNANTGIGRSKIKWEAAGAASRKKLWQEIILLFICRWAKIWSQHIAASLLLLNPARAPSCLKS